MVYIYDPFWYKLNCNQIYRIGWFGSKFKTCKKIVYRQLLEREGEDIEEHLFSVLICVSSFIFHLYHNLFKFLLGFSHEFIGGSPFSGERQRKGWDHIQQDKQKHITDVCHCEWIILKVSLFKTLWNKLFWLVNYSILGTNIYVIIPNTRQLFHLSLRSLFSNNIEIVKIIVFFD